MLELLGLSNPTIPLVIAYIVLCSCCALITGSKAFLGMGLFIATPSYNGQMSFSVTSTSDVIPDMRFFISCLEKSLSELKRATTPAKSKRVKKKGKAVRKHSEANGDQPPGTADLNQ